MTKRQATTGLIVLAVAVAAVLTVKSSGQGAAGRKKRSSRTSGSMSARSSGRRSAVTSRLTGRSIPSLPATGQAAAGASSRPRSAAS